MAASAANEAQSQGPQVSRAPQANVVQDILNFCCLMADVFIAFLLLLYTIEFAW